MLDIKGTFQPVEAAEGADEVGAPAEPEGFDARFKRMRA
jgi:hypothetical protein